MTLRLGVLCVRKCISGFGCGSAALGLVVNAPFARFGPRSVLLFLFALSRFSSYP
jgi:hypothetical protein